MYTLKPLEWKSYEENRFAIYANTILGHLIISMDNNVSLCTPYFVLEINLGSVDNAKKAAEDLHFSHMLPFLDNGEKV